MSGILAASYGREQSGDGGPSRSARDFSIDLENT
jgi:hypothetical protein